MSLLILRPAFSILFVIFDSSPRSTLQEVIGLLLDWCNGDQSALDKLMSVVYDELHRQASRYLHRERPDHTLQATALVNEAYLQLVDQT